MNWAVKMFREWHAFRLTSTITTEGELNVLKDIDEMDASDITFCLQKFIFDIRKKNGERYLAKILYDVFSMLNYYLQNNLGKTFSLFKRVEFVTARKCLEAARKETSASGIISGKNRSRRYQLKKKTSCGKVESWDVAMPNNCVKPLFTKSVFIFAFVEEMTFGGCVRSERSDTTRA